jgi:hypothetical protein
VGHVHTQLESRYRAKLIREGWSPKKDPFFRYKPDIYATKGKVELVVEVEICSSFDTEHTMDQLTFLYDYAVQERRCRGILVVPESCCRSAEIMMFSRFGRKAARIPVVGLRT